MSAFYGGHPLKTRYRLTRALRGAFGLTAQELARILGVPVPSVRRLIHAARRQGAPIDIAFGFYALPRDI